MNISKVEKNDYQILVEDILRYQYNIKIAKSKYGNILNGKIINRIYSRNEKPILTLVCSDDTSLIFGKPLYPDNFKEDEYKITVIDGIYLGLYSIEVSNRDNIIKTHQANKATDYKYMETKCRDMKYIIS